MKWTGLNELRESYLSFFESKGCLRHKSFPLIPQNDKSLLLINAGMAPLKPYFTKQEVPPRSRMTTCQKCVRTNDIENVGKTARHGTFFEMLGNFSFGDYFKEEAIAWAWEYITKVLEIPEDRLYVTVYQDDDEAERIWHEKVGVPMERIKRMGKEDNFWEAGIDGPCGPCSEIYFDRGKEYGCGKPDCGVGCDCDRYMEFWNLVFTQFERHEDGSYTPLQQKNIDTGMGLERLAALMQGVDSIFDVDTVKAIRDHICQIAGCEYGKEYKKDVSIRVITDHIRTVTFMASDGVLPSNEGRGYVMRRLLRRAVRHGKLLGINGLFLKDLVRTVVDCSKCEYSELEEKYDYIVRLLTNEERNFNETIDRGLVILNGYIDEIFSKHLSRVLDGKKVFSLSDTYGFPIDLTREILQERGIELDEEGFVKALAVQKETARAARGDSKYMGADETVFHKISREYSSKFVGYDRLEDDVSIDYIATEDSLVDAAGAGEEVYIVSSESPFYAESGGQAGDIGYITTKTGKCRVLDTQKAVGDKFAHRVIVEEGAIESGEQAHFEVDRENRLSIMRNHSCAHLLQSALRRVLGDHVHQAGQLVTADRLRFDFSHFAAMTQEELSAVEELVNSFILSAIPITTSEMPIDEAKRLGAMALFGEKYGDTVRVVSMEDASIELCGGTHLDSTSKIGLFKITSESGVAAGVRRIEAVTGKGVLDFINRSLGLINESAAALKLANPNDLARRCHAVQEELRELERKNSAMSDAIAELRSSALLANVVIIDGIKLVVSNVNGAKPDDIRRMAESIRSKGDDIVVVMACVNEGRVNLCAACGKEAVSRGVPAGKLVSRVASLIGGKGGGRPETAMAGGGDEEKLGAAMMQVDDILREFLTAGK